VNGLKVLIVGGGIAGLSCAIALRKFGHDVHLVEIGKSWQAHSTGISLAGHTYRALSRVGVADEVSRLGFTSVGTRINHQDGTHLRDIPAPPQEVGLPLAGGIMRPALQDILVRKARVLGARISLGVTLSHIQEKNDAMTVDFTDGTTGAYDLLVGADGVHSEVRSLIFPEVPDAQFTGQCCFRLTGRRPPEVDRMTFFLGNPIKAGVTPASQRELFMWLLSPEPTDEFYAPERQLSRLKDVLQGFGGVIGKIRDALTPETEIVYRPLKAIILPRPWHRGRIIVVGDAAHATTPHLTSGGSAAVEDGWLLAEYLTNATSIEAALHDFTERRFQRCRFIVETSLRIGELEVAGAPHLEQQQLFAEGMKVLAEPA
jgi:2-polyprenyl-6-methoxyphenol hydroxylase-like FAD-dependent oxidoreductase